MPRFIGINNVEAIPGLSPQALQALSAIKTNLELLMGQRGETNSASAAIRRENISLTPSSISRQRMTRSSSTGSGFTVSDVSVASAADHSQLVNDVNSLAQDVADLRTVLEELIKQLKS